LEWEDKRIEEVQTYKYLGFVLSNKGNYKEHIRKLRGKGGMAARRIWVSEKNCVGMI